MSRPKFLGLCRIHFWPDIWPTFDNRQITRYIWIVSYFVSGRILKMAVYPARYPSKPDIRPNPTNFPCLITREFFLYIKLDIGLCNFVIYLHKQRYDIWKEKYLAFNFSASLWNNSSVFLNRFFKIQIKIWREGTLYEKITNNFHQVFLFVALTDL